MGILPCGFPHSEICGSTLICSSPQLIAAYRVLRRLLVPRHSPCALSNLTKLANFSSLNYMATSFLLISVSTYPYGKTFFNYLTNLKLFSYLLPLFNVISLFSFQCADCLTGLLTSLWWTVPCPSANLCQYRALSEPHKYYYSWFGLFRVRSPLLAESRLISFPRPT